MPKHFPQYMLQRLPQFLVFFSEKSTLQSFGESLVSERFLTFCDSCICKDLFKLTEIAPPEVVSLWKLLRFGGFFGQKLHLIQKTFALFEAFFVSVFFYFLWLLWSRAAYFCIRGPNSWRFFIYTWTPTDVEPACGWFALLGFPTIYIVSASSGICKTC